MKFTTITTATAILAYLGMTQALPAVNNHCQQTHHGEPLEYTSMFNIILTHDSI